MNTRCLQLLAIILVMASPLIVPAQQGAGAPGEVLTLDEAVSLALRENRQVKNAQLSVGKAGDEVAAARCRLKRTGRRRERRLSRGYRCRRRPVLFNRQRAPADGDLRRADSPAAVAATPHSPGH